MIYLFEFIFEKFNINSHLVNWCKEHEIDYTTGHLGGIYADIYGIGQYFRLNTVAIKDGVFEVYADKTDYIYNNGQFKRLYTQCEKAIKIDYPLRKVELIMSDGRSNIKTDVALPSLVIKKDYIGRIFARDNESTSQVIDVKIVA